MSVSAEGHLVTLRHESGAKAIVHLMGALVVSWVASDGVERLYTSELTPWTKQDPIPRGGIPICYPQFGRQPSPEQVSSDPLLAPLVDPRNTQHGFAKSLPWQLDGQDVNSGVCSARFVLPANAVQVALPSTTVYYTVTLEAGSLLTTLSIGNHSDQAFKVRPGLHPYFKIRRDNVRIGGLEQGLEWVDGTRGGVQGTWSGGDVTWDAQTGSRARSWLTPGGHVLRIHDGASSFKMAYSGFTDATFWNTGNEAGTFARGEDFTDMKTEDNDRFICIEPSYRNAWQELGPGATIQASMRLEAQSE